MERDIQPVELRNRQKRRFEIVKLEERIAPSLIDIDIGDKNHIADKNKVHVNVNGNKGLL